MVAEKDAYNEIVIAEQTLVSAIEKEKEPLPEGDKKVHIIGMRAHAESHHHSHAEGTCHEPTHDQVLDNVGHSHSEIGASTNEVLEHVRHVVVAQVNSSFFYAISTDNISMTLFYPTLFDSFTTIIICKLLLMNLVFFYYHHWLNF